MPAVVPVRTAAYAGNATTSGSIAHAAAMAASYVTDSRFFWYL